MREPDSLDALLKEKWKAPSPSEELDQRVLSAYQSAVRRRRFSMNSWRQIWTMRISVPVPALAAAVLAIAALFIWLRPAVPLAVSSETARTVIELRASEFQPLPDGEARVVRISRN